MARSTPPKPPPTSPPVTPAPTHTCAGCGTWWASWRCGPPWPRKPARTVRTRAGATGVDMLGFNGHFASKSRRYSTTLGRLRQARRDYTRHRHLRPLSDPAGVIELDADLDEVETTLMVGVLAVRRYQLAHHRRRRPRVGRPRPRRLTRPPQASAAAGRTGEAVHSSASP
ncbi:MAG TPA: replication initiator [Microlunatus sp.]|nr:replication initiator [Microlunatus sp.]